MKRPICYTVIGTVQMIIFVLLYIDNGNLRERIYGHVTEPPMKKIIFPAKNVTILDCKPGIPCEYEDEVGIRIVVLTQKRTESLLKTLASLEDLVTDGDSAALEIWIDRLKDGSVSNDIVHAANNFTWFKGIKRVHIQQKNVGILGQWIDTWRPKADTKELCLMLEDDVDVSPYFYRFVRTLHKNFGHLDFLQGYSLQDEQVIAGKLRLKSNGLPKEQIFMNLVAGPWGLVPHPQKWRLFQDWYHEKRKDPSFKPYIPEAKLINGWYTTFVKQGTEDNMWTMWYYRFAFDKHLWTINTNLRSYYGKNRGLSWNRQEAGLHYSSKGQRESKDKLIQEWDESFTTWPKEIKLIGYGGTVVEQYEIEAMQNKSTQWKSGNNLP